MLTSQSNVLRALVLTVSMAGATLIASAQRPAPLEIPTEMRSLRVDETATCAALYRLLATREAPGFERDNLREKDTALQLFLDLQFNWEDPDPDNDDYDWDRSEDMIRTAAYAFSLADQNGVNWRYHESRCDIAHLDRVIEWLASRPEFHLLDHRWTWK